jgi:DNA polymerase II small subunit/DNA polymerase delta subunit B
MSKEDAGTTLIDLMKQVGANRDVKSVNRLTDFAGSSDDPTIQNKTKLFLQSMEKTDKQMAEVIGHAINEKKVENETMRNDLLKQSSRTVSSEADLSLKYKKDGFDIGGSVKAGASGDLKKYADEQLKLLDKNEGFRQELNTNLKSGKEQSGGGETFVIGSAVVELGDAPRIYHNSLLYPAPAQGKGGGK